MEDLVSGEVRTFNNPLGQSADAVETPAPVADEAEDYAHMPELLNDAQRRVQALADAKRITEEKGITSPDARIAWELVEELAATDSHHKTVGSG